MNLSLLRLRTLLNQPALLDLSRPWMALDAQSPPTVLVLQPPLAQAVLRHPAAQPFDVLAHLCQVSGLSPADLPAVSGYFGATPLLMHGAQHLLYRRDVMLRYRKVEEAMPTWLPALTRGHLHAASQQAAASPQALVVAYTNAVFRTVLARGLGVDAAALPPLPGRIFEFFPKRAEMLAREQELSSLFQAVLHGLMQPSSPGGSGQPPDRSAAQAQAWLWLTLVLMGHDALQGVLLWGLLHPGDVGGAAGLEALFRASAPVGVQARRWQADATVLGKHWVAGQTIYVSPHLLQCAQAAQQGVTPDVVGNGILEAGARDNAASIAARVKPPSFSFGEGPHACPGRKIAHYIASVFFDQLALLPPLHWSGASMRFVRDLLLQPRLLSA